MALDTPINKFSNNQLLPLYEPERARRMPVNLPPSSNYTKGTVLGQVGTSAVNAVQIWTISGSPGSGNFIPTLVIGGKTFTLTALAYNAASTGASSVQAALQAALGTANVTASGSAGGPYTVTYLAQYGGMPIPAPTFTNTFNTGSIASAQTTAGATAGTFDTYSSAVLAAPTTAATVSATGSDGTWGAGSYPVTYTLVTAAGETTPSPEAIAILTSAQHIAITSITGLDNSVTNVNFYVDGVLAKTQAVTSNATGAVSLTAPSTSLTKTPPTVNTAYTASGSLSTAKGFLMFDCETDSNGRITYGLQSTGNEHYQYYGTVPLYQGGIFDTSLITGLDAKALVDMGAHLQSGTVTNGVVVIP